MSNKFLAVFASNAHYENEKLRPRMVDGTASPKEVATFCLNLRRMGIGSLLLMGDVKSFQSWLYQSGRAFLVRGLQTGGASAFALSRCTPFFDALAAYDLQGAREMALVAPRARTVDLEYEEDFLYVRFLMDHCLLGGSEGEGRACLERFEAVLQGSEEPRLDVCKALLARDERGLGRSLLWLLSSRLRRFEGLREKGSLGREEWAMEAKLCVEGLALVLLAEQAGMKTEWKDAPGLPFLARCREPLGEPTDSWMQPS